MLRSKHQGFFPYAFRTENSCECLPVLPGCWVESSSQETVLVLDEKTRYSWELNTPFSFSITRTIRFVNCLLEQPEVSVVGAGRGPAGSIIHKLFINAQRVRASLIVLLAPLISAVWGNNLSYDASLFCLHICMYCHKCAWGFFLWCSAWFWQ